MTRLILGVADQFWFNAEASHLFSLLRAIRVHAKQKIIFLYPDIYEYHRAVESCGITGFSYKTASRKMMPFILFDRISSLLEKFEPDWVFSSSTNGTICAKTAVKIKGLNPNFAYIRGVDKRPKGGFLSKKQLLCNDLLIAPSKIIGQGHFGALGLKSSLIPQPVDERIFFPSEHKSKIKNNQEIRILCVGRLDPVKGHKVLIESCAQLIKKGYNIQLIFQGPEKNISKKSLVSLAHSLDIDRRLRILLPGELEPDAKWGAEVAIMMRKADILAVPSLDSERNCRVLLEAMACGLPSVVSNVGSLPEICENGRTGFICEKGDAVSFAHSLENIIAGNLAEGMGKAAYNQYISKYSSPIAAKRLLRLMKKKEKRNI